MGLDVHVYMNVRKATKDDDPEHVFTYEKSKWDIDIPFEDGEEVYFEEERHERFGSYTSFAKYKEEEGSDIPELQRIANTSEGYYGGQFLDALVNKGSWYAEFFEEGEDPTKCIMLHC